MADKGKTPGSEVGKQGGIYREVGPRGGKIDNFATVRDGHRLPPTTQPGHKWEPMKITPNSNDKRK